MRLIRIGAKLSKIVALQEEDWKPLIYYFEEGSEEERKPTQKTFLLGI